MKLINKIGIGLGITGLIVLSAIGCEERPQYQQQIKPEPAKPVPKDYFAEVPMRGDSGMAMTNGDFDGDGDLDLIIGAMFNEMTFWEGRLYYFENDGEGNFTMKPPKNY